jgi:hypothetical protein
MIVEQRGKASSFSRDRHQPFTFGEDGGLPLRYRATIVRYNPWKRACTIGEIRSGY